VRTELDLMARTRRFLQRSEQLLLESEKLVAEWQKLIDDQTAKTIKRISARLKRNGPNSGSTLPWQAIKRFRKLRTAPGCERNPPYWVNHRASFKLWWALVRSRHAGEVNPLSSRISRENIELDARHRCQLVVKTAIWQPDQENLPLKLCSLLEKFRTAQDVIWWATPRQYRLDASSEHRFCFGTSSAFTGNRAQGRPKLWTM